MVDQTGASWNHIATWLRRVDQSQPAAELAVTAGQVIEAAEGSMGV